MKTTYILILLFCMSAACNKEDSDSTVETSVVGPASGVGRPLVADSGSSYPTVTFVEQFTDLVNDHRRSIGLRALIHSDEMAAIATAHSTNMASKIVSFGHTEFSARCSDARTVMGGGNWCGENVAFGQKSPEDVFASWMNSPGHRANIENSRATHMGLGYARSSSGTYYWTQLLLEVY